MSNVSFLQLVFRLLKIKIGSFSVFLILALMLTTHAQDSKAPTLSLNMAVLQGNEGVVDYYIQSGNYLNEKDQFGSTPLIIAATFGQIAIAKKLIKAGADLEIKNNDGSTPLQIASFFGRTEIVINLIEAGANKYTRNSDGASAYDIVASPFEWDLETYKNLSAMLGPIGLKIDYDQIKKARSIIAQLLRPKGEELTNIKYEPVDVDDWVISSPTETNLNKDLIDELYLDASQLETLYSLLIIKDGALICEGYFNKGSVNQLSKRASVTKSFVSALFGIAIREGYVKGVDEKMLKYFPEVGKNISDPRKRDITLQQMLQMRSGFPWEETDSTYWNALWSGTYIDKIESIPLSAEPGTKFQYSNMTSNWLGMIITRTSGNDLRTFGEEYLFDPLNISVGDWNRDWNGYYIGSGDMEMTARDLAKFGQLYLNGGIYKNEQIVPKEWVQESLKKYSKEINSAGIEQSKVGRYFYDIGYGYQWWSASIGNHKIDFAWGHGGQLIILLKEYNIVIVTTADPFFGKKEHWLSWQHEKAIINIVGKFISSLPEIN